MELHYLWIYQFGYLKNTGINLSARFIFTIDLTENNINKGRVLRIEHNPDYIPAFFEKPNIKNVTALIGKNGAGKSSILNYIKSHLPQGLEANVDHDIFAYSFGNGNEEKFILVYPDAYQLTVDDKTSLFMPSAYFQFPDTPSYRDAARLSDADYIYYSFFFDFKREEENWSGLHNISTGALLQAERRQLIEENMKDEDTLHQKMTFSSDMDRLIITEIGKAVQFIISDQAHLIPFKKPDELWITINDTDGLYFNERNEKDADLFHFLTELQEHTAHQTAIEGTLNTLLLALFINFMYNERKFSPNIKSKHQLRINKDESIKDFVIGFFSGLKKTDLYLDNRKMTYGKYRELSTKVPAFIAFTESLMQRGVLLPDNNQNTHYLKLKLNQDSDADLKAFMNYYLEIKGISTFLDFGWRGLSTGEQSYLSFMARFHHLRYHDHGDIKRNLVIMIDEGDAGYHPEWQRVFFNDTLNFLSRLYQGYSLQLIFTANTPFLSSDLPKSHIVFIEKKADKSSVFKGKYNDREETFGANIHTLYSNSFYMEGALIGEFAKEKINNIIKYLDNKEVTTPDPRIRKIIDIIGEPIVRHKLEDMWNTKFGLDEEIEMLRNRIAEIEKIKRKRP